MRPSRQLEHRVLIVMKQSIHPKILFYKISFVFLKMGNFPDSEFPYLELWLYISSYLTNFRNRVFLAFMKSQKRKSTRLNTGVPIVFRSIVKTSISRRNSVNRKNREIHEIREIDGIRGFDEIREIDEICEIDEIRGIDEQIRTFSDTPNWIT